jgi:hypothetical protein
MTGGVLVFRAYRSEKYVAIITNNERIQQW